jgi:4-hydroxybenzoate polyprenyltransferase
MNSKLEKSIHAAIQDLKNGVFTSERAAARAYGVPRSTLKDRLRGSTNRIASHEFQQRLSREQEEYLADWIIELDREGNAPSHARVREMASRILRQSGDTQSLGKEWIKHFRQRNPRVNTCIGKTIDSKRIEGTQPEKLQAFYNLFSSVRDRFNIQTEDMWNMDEHGIAQGVCEDNRRVLGEVKKGKTLVQAAEKGEWVTILECISAAGQYLKPLVIFKGKALQSSWFKEGEVPDWLYTTSENGWTSNKIGVQWLIHVFLPQTIPRNGRHRLLLMDGYCSHLSIDFLWTCKQNNVHLVFLPAHSSHVLQSLDLGVYSPLKTRYRTLLEPLASFDDSSPLKKQNFVLAYNQAREAVLTPICVRNGWKTAGIVPFNPSKGLNSSQLRIQRKKTSDRPKTPPDTNINLSNPLDPLLNTPRSHKDVQKAARKLERSGRMNRDQRTFFRKTSSLIERLNAQQAEQQATIARLSRELETFKSAKVKKRV